MSEIQRVYELGYLLNPTTPEAEVETSVEKIKAVLTGKESVLGAEGAPEFIDLSYTMEKSIGSKKSKYSSAYFGWIKFTVDPADIAAIQKALDSNNEVIRYILIKTSMDNVVVFKRAKGERRGLNKKEELFESLVTPTDDTPVEEGIVIDATIAPHEQLPNLEQDLVEEIK